jgi:hypothetical protein
MGSDRISEGLAIVPLPMRPHGAIKQFCRYGCLVVIALLALATWRRYSNWPSDSDIGLWDETIYLNGGLSHTFDFASYEQAPLYEAYYYAVGLFIHDATDVYFFGGLVLQLITLCSIGFVTWILSRSLAVAALTFGLVLCSPFLLSWPRVSYLAVVFVVLGSWLATLETRVANRLALTTLVSFIICFVRPEFVITMYLAGGALLVVLIGWTGPEIYRFVRGRAQVEIRDLCRLAAYLSAAGVLCFAWSFPLLQGGQRAMAAWSQHYAVRWVSDHGWFVNPWLYYMPIVEKVFPGAKTPAQALLSNPTEWLRFTVHNMLGSIPSMRSLLSGPESRMIALGLFGLLFVSAWSMPNRMQSVGFLSVLKSMPFVECALYAVAPLAAMVLIYPEPHYAVILLSALMICCVAVGRRHSWSKVSDLFIALLAALAIALAVHPLPVTDRPVLQTIIELRDLNLPIRRMLEADGGWCAYLKPPCTLEYASEGVPVLKTVLDRKVDAILISPTFRHLLWTRNDQSLDELINQRAGGMEWRRYEIGDGQYLLLYREMSP